MLLIFRRWLNLIANKLRVLLAERNLKIKDVVESTGLSRNTVSNLVNSPLSNISNSTLDKLCLLLKITPCDFFEYYPGINEFVKKENEYYFHANNGKQDIIKRVYLELVSSEISKNENLSENSSKEVQSIFRLKIEDVSYDYITNLIKKLPLILHHEFIISIITVYIFYLDRELKRNPINEASVGIFIGDEVFHLNLEALARKNFRKVLDNFRRI